MRQNTRRRIAAALLLALTSAAARAQEAPQRGLYVTVRNPIQEADVTRIQDTIDRAINRKADPVKKVIFDFNPDGKDAATRNYGSCFSLALYVRNTLAANNVTTIAYLRGRVSEHSVLPVLACSEVVMTKSAALGEVVDDAMPAPPKTVVDYYRELARGDRGPFVVKMCDKSAEVLKAVERRDDGKPGAVRYFLAGERDKFPDLVGVEEVPVVPAGSTKLYSAKEARRFGLCQQIVGSRSELAELYRLAPSSLRDDPLSGREPKPWLVKLRGPVDGGLRETLQRRLKYATSRGGNLIFLQLEVDGGDPRVAATMARDDLAKVTAEDGGPVSVVAFLPDGAGGTATILALGCDAIAMYAGKKGGGAKPPVVGDFAQVVERAERRPEPGRPDVRLNLDLLRQSLVELAASQNYPPLLVRGMLDKDLVIVRAVGKKDPTRRRLMSRTDFDEANLGERVWVNGGQVKPAGELLTLTAERARDLGLVRHLTDNPDPAEVYAQYGLTAGDVREAKPDWLDAVAAFLREPVVRAFLIMIGFAALFIELKIPGFTLAGVISAVCFVLFFWASFMGGQFDVLAVLLFLLGVILIGLEIFVIPGFGVTGVSGIILLIGGLGLASVDQVPRTASEWSDFGVKSLSYAGSILAAGALALVLARFLPNIPYANRLILAPPSEAEDDEEAGTLLPGGERAMALLGAIGVAQTMLRPSGMAQFGEEFVDVVSEGGYIASGARVQVVEVEGTRVVVKEV